MVASLRAAWPGDREQGEGTLIELRSAHPADFARIVELNAQEEAHTSAMDVARLEDLHRLACCHRVAIIDQRVAGFLLAMRDGAAYPNPNFAWFAARYLRFIYVDRIVVDRQFAGQGVGSALYRDLFGFARRNDVATLACEINIQPPNPLSTAFHRRFGFNQVGTQEVAGGSKLVSLQVADVDAWQNGLQRV